jgi:hypothetical protein
MRPHLGKNPSQKRADGVAQVVERLPSKPEALSSKPSTTPKKKGMNPIINMTLCLGGET